MHLSTGEKNDTFGDRLREERERLGFSQTSLGNEVDTSKKTIINWEQNTTAPDTKQLMELHGLRFNITYMLFGATAEAVQQVSPAYTPAEHAAFAVRSLKLTENDAEMVVALAKRLSIQKG